MANDRVLTPKGRVVPLRRKNYYMTHNPYSVRSRLRYGRNLLLLSALTVVLLPLVFLCFLTIAGIPLGIIIGGAPLGTAIHRRNEHITFWLSKEQAMTVTDEYGDEVQVPWTL